MENTLGKELLSCLLYICSHENYDHLHDHLYIYIYKYECKYKYIGEYVYFKIEIYIYICTMDLYVLFDRCPFHSISNGKQSPRSLSYTIFPIYRK